MLRLMASGRHLADLSATRIADRPLWAGRRIEHSKPCAALRARDPPELETDRVGTPQFAFDQSPSSDLSPPASAWTVAGARRRNPTRP